MRDLVVTLADGRALTVADYGPEDAPATFYFHGAPTSRLDPGLFEHDIDAQGVRIIGVDRPSCGGSTPQPGRVLTDWAGDVAEVADRLNVGSFAVTGLSAGGAYAIMCAALLSDRVIGLGTVAAGADPAWSRDRREADMNALFDRNDEDEVVRHYADRYGADASGFPVGSTGLGQPDVEIFADDGHGPALRHSVGQHFRQGVAGFALDGLVRSRPWPFDPGSITARCEVLHGEQDVVVDIAQAERIHELVPGSRLTRLADHGHLSIIAELPRLAARLTS